MSREPHDSVLGGQPLAVWFGPERVALALSVLLVIALAFALGIGPFAAAPGSSSAPSSPAPSGAGAGLSGDPRPAVSLPDGEAFDGSSIPGRPASTQP